MRLSTLASARSPFWEISLGDFLLVTVFLVGLGHHSREYWRRYAREGGFVDFTTSTVQAFLDEGEVKSSTGLRPLRFMPLR